MKWIAIFAFVLVAGAANAAEPTLNDLPSILQKLRGCTEKKTTFSSTTVCSIPKADLWVAIHGDGELAIFRQRRNADSIYASGSNIGELLRNFAAKLNAEREENKAMLDGVAQYLPTQ